jgi:sortase (surface protein transpeptidase)
MTMTTCHPKYTAEKRMIVHAVLARGLNVVPGARPKELGGRQ